MLCLLNGRREHWENWEMSDDRNFGFCWMAGEEEEETGVCGDIFPLSSLL